MSAARSSELGLGGGKLPGRGIEDFNRTQISGAVIPANDYHFAVQRDASSCRYSRRRQGRALRYRPRAGIKNVDGIQRIGSVRSADKQHTTVTEFRGRVVDARRCHHPNIAEAVIRRIENFNRIERTGGVLAAGYKYASVGQQRSGLAGTGIE